MVDVVERLVAALNDGMRPGTANSDVNVLSEPLQITRGAVDAALREILRLRAEIVAIRQMAGCVEVPLKTFADIKKELKHG